MSLDVAFQDGEEIFSGLKLLEELAALGVWGRTLPVTRVSLDHLLQIRPLEPDFMADLGKELPAFLRMEEYHGSTLIVVHVRL